MAREDMIRDAMRTVDTYNEIYEPTPSRPGQGLNASSPERKRNGASRAARWWPA